MSNKSVLMGYFIALNYNEKYKNQNEVDVDDDDTTNSGYILIINRNF